MGWGRGKLKLLKINKKMNDDLVNKTDDELEAIVRRAENTNIPGSLFQRAKIELELRDRKREATHDMIATVKVQATIEKRIKRGKESWNFFWLVFSIFLAIAIFITSILPLEWLSKALVFMGVFIVLVWACLINAWWQNKLIGLKNWTEEKWKKI